MRIALLSMIAACGGGGGDICQSNAHCSGDYVCARDGSCSPASEVRTLRVTWTIRGAAANTTNCAPAPDLYVLFHGFEPGDTVGFEPVPCETGLFFVDMLPRRFTSVELGERNGFELERPITAAETVMFDLMP